MVIYKPTDVLGFGKNKGLHLSKVYQYQPSYIEWAILKIDEFCIDLDEFERLKDPTTINYNSHSFNPEKILRLTRLEFNIENLTEFLKNNDSFNVSVDVQYIIEQIESAPDSLQLLKDFKFPEHIRAINCYKILLSSRE